MKVWLLMWTHNSYSNCDHRETDVLGVFSSEEKANAALDEESKPSDYEDVYDSYFYIKEYDVDVF